MPRTVIARMTDPTQSSRGKTYYADYAARIKADDALQASLETQWSLYQAGDIQLWYRPASSKTQVEAAFPMPSDVRNISGLYRIECFVPDKNASAIARYVLTVQDDQNNLVEKTAFINQNHYSNTWVPLGDFRLSIGDTPVLPQLGQVRQFDDTRQANVQKLKVAFGPVRWVPLYQTPDPLYTLVDSDNFKAAAPDQPEGEVPAPWWSVDQRRSVEQPPDNSRQIDWGPARWLGLTASPNPRNIQADYTLPAPTPSGRYRVEAFIPFWSSGLLSKKVRCQVHTGPGADQISETAIDQSANAGKWVSLGQFDLDFPQVPDPAAPQVGQVTILCTSSRLTRSALGPVRWIPMFEQTFEPGKAFDFPIGTPAQRTAAIVRRNRPLDGKPASAAFNFWLEDWYDATPFLTPYYLGLHTGADLNYARGSGLHLPVFAAADGKITFASQIMSGSWNYLIVVEHENAIVNIDGRHSQQKVYTRYGHVHKDSLTLEGVKVGLPVKCGQQIGYVGFMRDPLTGKDKPTGEHLHFDVCYTDKLLKSPEYWPPMSELAALYSARKTGTDDFQHLLDTTSALVRKDFVDPLDFIASNHTRSPLDDLDPGQPVDNGLLSAGAPRFDFPLGSPDQRAMEINLRPDDMQNGLFLVGVEQWYCSTDFLALLPGNIPLPGVNLILPNGLSGEKTVYACGDGKVVFAGRCSLGPTYPNVLTVIISHPSAAVCRQPGLGELKPVFTRCAGLANIFVHAGQDVKCGDPIGALGSQPSATLPAGSPLDWWLHFSVSDSQTLQAADHWPLKQSPKEDVQKDYLHPLQWIIDNHPSAPVLQKWRPVSPA